MTEQDEISLDEMPTHKYKLEELKYPLAIFGIDDHLNDLLRNVIVALSEEKMFSVSQYDELTGTELKDANELITNDQLKPYLPNLRIISMPFKMYLEVFAVDHHTKEIRAIVYGEEREILGSFTHGYELKIGIKDKSD